MKNGIKIAVLGLMQLAIASQASAQLVIAQSQVALNLPPVQVVAIKDIPKLDLVAIQSVEVQNVTELGLEQLVNVQTDLGANEPNQVVVQVTLASAVIPTPPSTTTNSTNYTNTTNSTVATYNNNPVFNGTTGQIDKFGNGFPVGVVGEENYQLLRQGGGFKLLRGSANETIHRTLNEVSIEKVQLLIDY